MFEDNWTEGIEQIRFSPSDVVLSLVISPAIVVSIILFQKQIFVQNFSPDLFFLFFFFFSFIFSSPFFFNPFRECN